MKNIGVLDGGPIYTETDLSNFPVEPFNTYSNVFFLLVIFYWVARIYRSDISYKTKRFLYFSLPLLSVGYIGGTIYHATRMHRIWLLLDVVPIFILAFSLAFMFWRRVERNVFLMAFYIILIFMLPRISLRLLSPDFYALNGHSINYACLILGVLFPIIKYEYKTNFKSLSLAILGFSFIGAALFFRVIDSSHFIKEHFSIGTHWIWHSFGAIGSHFSVLYYEDSQKGTLQ